MQVYEVEMDCDLLLRVTEKLQPLMYAQMGCALRLHSGHAHRNRTPTSLPAPLQCSQSLCSN